MRFLMTGVLAIGSALAGGIGQFVGIRAALWVSSIGLALVWLALFFSPMRGMRELPQEPLEDSDSAPSVPHRAPEPPTALEQPTVEQPTVGGAPPGQGRLTITVRPAVESDLPTVLALYGELQTADVPSSFGPAARVWQETAAQVGRTILLAVVDGFVVGTVDCMILPSLTRGGRPFMLVENLVVASAVRRHGVGRRLVGTAVTLARSAGCYEVQLTSRVDRADVHGFYESCGFQPVATGYRARL